MTMKTTEWKEYTENGERYRIRATYGLDYDFAAKNHQPPHFSITGEVERKTVRWRWSRGGCIHEELVIHFHELAPLIKWHLCALGQGPLHYVANGLFWWEHVIGLRSFRRDYEWQKYGSVRDAALALFKSTVIFGTVPTDSEDFLRGQIESGPALARCVEYKIEHPSIAAIRDWQTVRLPKLLKLFREAMDAAGVREPAREAQR